MSANITRQIDKTLNATLNAASASITKRVAKLLTATTNEASVIFDLSHLRYLLTRLLPMVSMVRNPYAIITQLANPYAVMTATSNAPYAAVSLVTDAYADITVAGHHNAVVELGNTRIEVTNEDIEIAWTWELMTERLSS